MTQLTHLQARARRIRATINAAQDLAATLDYSITPGDLVHYPPLTRAGIVLATTPDRPVAYVRFVSAPGHARYFEIDMRALTLIQSAPLPLPTHPAAGSLVRPIMWFGLSQRVQVRGDWRHYDPARPGLNVGSGSILHMWEDTRGMFYTLG